MNTHYPITDFRNEAQRSHVNNSRYSVKCLLVQPLSKILSLHYAENWNKTYHLIYYSTIIK